MASLGELVDKLMTVNMKLWHVQDEVHEAYKTGTDLPAEAVQRLTSLNLDRNRLMTEVDECLDAAAKTGQAVVDSRIKIV